MSLPYETTALPYFRVGGIAIRSQTAQRADDVAQLWAQQRSGRLNDLTAFSTSLYCVYHDYADDGSCTILLGKLIATDATLPDNMSDAWVAPQNYAVFTLPEKDVQSALTVWQDMAQRKDLARRHHVDFESYPAFGAAKLYVGLQGDVEMAEHVDENE